MCLECQDTGYLEPVEFGAKVETCPHCATGREEERNQREPLDIAGRDMTLEERTSLRVPEYRPLSPVDQLAVQTSYASVALIAAHLRKYFAHCEADDCDESIANPVFPRTVLDAADRTAKVLDQMRKGEQQQWGAVADLLDRAAFALEFLLTNHPEGPHPVFRETGTECRETADRMRPEPTSAAYLPPAERLAAMDAGGAR